MSRIYLAGPISGLSYDGATDWRERTKLELAPHVECLSPMRGSEHLKGRELLDDHDPNVLATTPAVLTARDKSDVRRSDLVLINFLGATKASSGTFIEIGWADAWQIPIVAVIDEGNPNKHAMGDVLTLQVPTLEMAIKLVKEILNIKTH